MLLSCIACVLMGPSGPTERMLPLDDPGLIDRSAYALSVGQWSEHMNRQLCADLAATRKKRNTGKVLNLYWWEQKLKEKGFVASKLKGVGARVSDNSAIVLDGNIRLDSDAFDQTLANNRTYVFVGMDWDL